MFYGSVGRVGLRALLAATAYTPASLFAAGEQGVWYQNSDFSTLFQDAAGGTPVTGLEQPVGLRLDKRVPIGQTGYNSVYFDGTNDYLTAGASSGALGSGDFTIETWSFLTSRVNDYPCIWSNYSSFAAGSLALFAGHASATTTRYQLAINGAGFPNIQSSISIAYNQWVHLAVVRRSGVITLYVNGVADGTFSSSANLSGTNGSSWIGTAGDAVTTGEIQGSLSNLRVVVGTAVYTGNFTPPKAPLTAIAGTALLACQNTTISDNGPNTVLITAFGDTKTTLANPFGNNAFQITSTSRPVLSARVNLLTYTEQFDNAAWTKDGATVSANAITSPADTLTADKIVESGTTAAHRVYSGAIAAVGGASYTLSVCAKAGERNWLALYFTTGGNAGAWFNLSTGVVGTTSANFTSAITALGNGWYRCSITVTPGVSANYYALIGPSSADNTTSYAGDGASGIYIWGADVRPTNLTTTLPVYQRVGAATAGTSSAAGTGDYDTTGFPYYLKFDGTDDFLVTGTINPGSVDKAQVFAGVRKLSDAAAGYLASFGFPFSGNSGSFSIGAPREVNIEYGAAARGGVLLNAQVDNSAYSAPYTNVYTTQIDIVGDSIIGRSNGAQFFSGAGDLGTGNFDPYALSVGQYSAAAGLRFNGHLYGLILRFSAANLDAATITATETWMNTKTKAF